MNYLGIDISKDSFDVTLLSEQKQKSHKFENTLEGIQRLLDWVKAFPPSEIHACMEATGKYEELLAEALYASGVRVSVVNPFKIKGFSSSELRRSKTDKLDAQLIARFCRAMCPVLWSPKSADEKAIRDLRRHADALTIHRTQVKNRLQTPALNETVKASCLAELEFLDNEISKLEREIMKLFKADRNLKTKYDLLTSIPGVGPKLAIIYMTEVSTTFANSRELEVYAGIAPRHRESGSSVRSRGQISKVGNSRLRKSLYMPALSAIRNNPKISEFYMRLREAGKPGKLAVCAVMRKLLRWMFAVLKSGTSFDLQYVSMRPIQAS